MKIRLTAILAVSWCALLITNPPARADLVPSDSLVELRAGQAYMPACECINSDRNEEAIRLFTIALGCPQKRCWAYANRARAYLRRGRLDEAASDLDAALAIANDDLNTLGPSAWCYEQRAWVYLVMDELDDKQPPTGWAVKKEMPLRKAAADLAKALAFDPERPRALRWQAYVLRRVGDWDGVISACDRLLDQDPTDFGCYLQRAYAYLQMLNITKSLEDCDAILNRMPLERRTLRLRGQIYATAGEMDEEWLMKGLALHGREIAQHPDVPGLYEARALIRFRTAQVKKALLDVERAVQCDNKRLVGELPLTSYVFWAAEIFGSHEKRPIQEGDRVGQHFVVEKGVMPILDRLCLASPEEGQFFLMRAWAYAALGLPEEGHADYLRATQLGVTLNDDMASTYIKTIYETPSLVKTKPAREYHEASVERGFKKDPEYWSTADTEAPAFDAAGSGSYRSIR